MRAFFKDLFWDMPKYIATMGFLGPFMAFLYLVVVLALIVMVGAMTLYLVDTVGVEPKPQAAVVESTRFIPAHVIIVNTMVGNVSVPQVHNIPDAWEVIVTTANDGTLGCPATRGQYTAAQPGQHATAWVKKGRLSGGPYCTRTQLP
jgi:hypothetical protein